MKIRFKPLFTIICSAYMLLISLGFTFSHIYCSKGEQWVMGVEMPPCKKLSKIKTCPNSGIKKCHKTAEKKPDERKKDTYNLQFEFVGNEVAAVDVGFFTFDLTFVPVSLISSVDYSSNTPVNKGLLRSNSPLDIFKPDLVQMQVFRI